MCPTWLELFVDARCAVLKHRLFSSHMTARDSAYQKDEDRLLKAVHDAENALVEHAREHTCTPTESEKVTIVRQLRILEAQ